MANYRIRYALGKGVEAGDRTAFKMFGIGQMGVAAEGPVAALQSALQRLDAYRFAPFLLRDPSGDALGLSESELSEVESRFELSTLVPLGDAVRIERIEEVGVARLDTR